MSCYYEEFMLYLKRIVLKDNKQVEEAWRKLEEMEQDERYAECLNMNNLRVVLNMTITLRNINELPKLLMWFSKFPKTAPTSNPISDDIANCLRENVEQFRVSLMFCSFVLEFILEGFILNF